MNDDKLNNTSTNTNNVVPNQTNSTGTPQITSPVPTNTPTVTTLPNQNVAPPPAPTPVEAPPVMPATNNTEPEEEKPNPLANMEGVKIAPASDGPVNASDKKSAAAANTKSSILSTPAEEKPINIFGDTEKKDETDSVNTSNVEVSRLERPGNLNNNKEEVEETKKKSSSFAPLFILIIIILGGYIYYSSTTHSKEIKQLRYNCSPVTASKKEIKLSLDSTLVKELYSMVATNIKEDVAQPYFNDNMRLYLAYRRIADVDKYSSNCNLFNTTSMEPFVCEDVEEFAPRAFKEDKLKQAIHEMYGDASTLQLTNVQLGNSCIGGYQYIPERGEFVQGYCKSQNSINYTVDKKLVKATSTRNTIVLTEDVKYHANESISLPEYFKNGLYNYTFKLDMNYNYILLGKQYESKY